VQFFARKWLQGIVSPQMQGPSTRIILRRAGVGHNPQYCDPRIQMEFWQNASTGIRRSFLSKGLFGRLPVPKGYCSKWSNANICNKEMIMQKAI
jgi:hypothetical protein